MIILYGSMNSRANRCAWMLKELGVEYQNVPTDFQNGATREPAFLDINPNGRVPVLDDGGFRLFESLAINLYLAHKFGGLVAPVTPQEDALATQWSCWALTEIEKPLLLAAANLKLFDAELRQPQEVEIAVKKLSRPWGVLEKHLTDRPYMLGDRFTVADLNIAAVMTLALSCGLDLDAWPRMKAWLESCLFRPAATDWRAVTFRIPRPPSPLGVLSMFV
jgi:glutathione S-transferase